MSRPVLPGTGGPGGGNAVAWAVPAVGAALLLASAAVWTGALLAAAVQGVRVERPPFSLLLVIQVLRDGTDSRWPGVSASLISSETINNQN